MKRILSRILGAAAAAVGLVGIMLSVAAVIYAWNAADRLRRLLPEQLGRLQSLVESVQQQGDATGSLLQTARQRVNAVSAAIDELSRRNERHPAAESILQTLDDDIGQRLQNADEFVASMQGSMRSMSSALLLLDSLPFFSAPVVAADGGPNRRWTSVAADLTEAADRLDEVRRIVGRMRTGQTVSPQQLEQVQESLDQIDRQLKSAQSEIRGLSQRLEETGTELTGLRAAVPRWIDRTAVAVSVFFTCFGFSQISLLLHGWKLLTR